MKFVKIIRSFLSIFLVFWVTLITGIGQGHCHAVKETADSIFLESSSTGNYHGPLENCVWCFYKLTTKSINFQNNEKYYEICSSLIFPFEIKSILQFLNINFTSRAPPSLV